MSRMPPALHSAVAGIGVTVVSAAEIMDTGGLLTGAASDSRLPISSNMTSEAREVSSNVRDQPDIRGGSGWPLTAVAGTRLVGTGAKRWTTTDVMYGRLWRADRRRARVLLLGSDETSRVEATEWGAGHSRMWGSSADITAVSPHLRRPPFWSASARGAAHASGRHVLAEAARIRAASARRSGHGPDSARGGDIDILPDTRPMMPKIRRPLAFSVVTQMLKSGFAVRRAHASIAGQPAPQRSGGRPACP